MVRTRSRLSSRPTLLAVALMASATLAPPVQAQAHAPAQRRAHARARHARPHAARPTARQANTPVQSDDYSLEIVAALFPYDDGMIRGEPVLTLVVENRGSAPAPAFSVDVTQRTRLASFSRSPVAMLAPGERAVVQIPLELTAHGAPCVAVTLDTSGQQGPPAQFYAALPPVPSVSTIAVQ